MFSTGVPSLIVSNSLSDGNTNLDDFNLFDNDEATSPHQVSSSSPPAAYYCHLNDNIDLTLSSSALDKAESMNQAAAGPLCFDSSTEMNYLINNYSKEKLTTSHLNELKYPHSNVPFEPHELNSSTSDILSSDEQVIDERQRPYQQRRQYQQNASHPHPEQQQQQQLYQHVSYPHKLFPHQFEPQSLDVSPEDDTEQIQFKKYPPLPISPIPQAKPQLEPKFETTIEPFESRSSKQSAYQTLNLAQSTSIYKVENVLFNSDIMPRSSNNKVVLPSSNNYLMEHPVESDSTTIPSSGLNSRVSSPTNSSFSRSNPTLQNSPELHEKSTNNAHFPKSIRKCIRRARRYSSPRSSRYCHLCARHQKSVKMVGCSNVEQNICQKSVCVKCIERYKLSRNTASHWICPHCENKCPPRAKCFAYDRQTAQRRQRTIQARIENESTRNENHIEK